MSTDTAVTPMLSSNDVARILNVHVNTVRRWTKNGTLQCYRSGPREDRKFRLEDVCLLLVDARNNKDVQA